MMENMDRSLYEKRKNLICELVNDKFYVPMKEKELAAFMQVRPEEREGLKTILNELLMEGRLQISKRGKYSKGEEGGGLVGTFISHPKGFGFVEIEGRSEDLYIPESGVNGAFHQDQVQVELLKGQGGRRQEARIVKILSHGLTKVVGTYQKSKSFGFVIPDLEKISTDIYIPAEGSKGAVTGHKVVVELTDYGDDKHKPEGRITEILGHVNDPGVDILSIVKGYDLPVEFEEKLLNQAERVGKPVSEADMAGRRDLRSLQMVTIDGEDAKDLDDAVSLTKEGENYCLGVHIADVSNYVQENSALDREALNRGTSVYLVDRVIPMLPHTLSNGICSLNQGEDRLALSCLMKVNKKGEVVSYEIAETVICVDRRMSYTAVRKILEEGDPELIQEYEELVPMFQDMQELAAILRKKRRQRGSIDFDFPESKIELDENGEPLSIHPHERNDATKLIEDFMLAANETVAQHFYWLEEPFLYRVHDNPDPEKMQQLSVFLGNFGYRLHIGRKQGKRQAHGAAVHPKQLQKLLDQIEGTPEEAMLSRLILRSMKRAVYSPECSGHFGLAATHYCHFTSPIRRYPDLQIHRIIKEFLRGRLNEKRKEHYEDILNGVAKHSSETERRADEAERICEKMKKAQYMEKHIGETMEAVISGVTGWGFYAELPNPVEGLVPVSSLRSDYFIFDEENSALVGEHTGKTYQLGETVTVRVTGANRYAGTVDFELEEAEKRGNDGKISTETGREQ